MKTKNFELLKLNVKSLRPDIILDFFYKRRVNILQSK